MNPWREAGKIGAMITATALAWWATKKTQDTWFGRIFWRGDKR